MAQLSADQIYSIAIGAGFSPEDAQIMTAIGLAESGGNTQAHGTGSPGESSWGIWQINIGSGLSRPWTADQLVDPVFNAQIAKQLYDGRPAGKKFADWSVYNNGSYKQYLSTANEAATRVNGGYTPPPVDRSGTAPVTAQGQGVSPTASNLPADGRLVRIPVGEGMTWIVYSPAPGVNIGYAINGQDTSMFGEPQDISFEEWDQMKIVDGGYANALGSAAATYGTFKGMWDANVMKIMHGNPAANDPSVMRVLAEVAARPDMTDAEIQAKLQQTDWYKNQTDLQRAWNDYAPAEQNARIAQKAADLVATYWNLTGKQISTADPVIQQWARDIASGAKGQGQFLEEYLKPEALKNSESPYARSIRTEEESQRQRGVDIENKTEEVRDLFRRWGIKPTEDVVTSWGKDITEKRKSDADLIESLKVQSAALYPGKPPDIETSNYAQPWLMKYEQTMENTSDIFNGDIQNALQKGMTLFDFERQLKGKTEWLSTKNAQDDLTSRVSSLGKMMGFS